MFRNFENKTYIISTLGCKANAYDSQRIESALIENGWRIFCEEGDVYPGICIINSCCVTAEAEKQSRKQIEKLNRIYPKTLFVWAGCSAEMKEAKEPEKIENIIRIGNRGKLRIAELVENLENFDLFTADWGKINQGHAHNTRTRAFLRIQEGCSRYCSYCIVPFVRGPDRSASKVEIAEEMNRLVSRGIREVVITGTNIGLYKGESNSATLCDLVEFILRETNIERLRLSSLDPQDINERLIQIMRNDSRVCPHFHVSLQSSSDTILRAMGRRYSWQAAYSKLQEIMSSTFSSGPAFIGMDVIVGFPGESEADFEEIKMRLNEASWTRLHVFPYSERSGTKAAGFSGSVPIDVRKNRAEQLRALSNKRMLAHHSEILTRHQRTGLLMQNVLIETQSSGYTPNYLRVVLPTGRANTNDLVDVKPISLSVDERAGEVHFLCE